MAKLTGPRRAPKSGQTKSLAIFLHGYGADGGDLIELSTPMADYMPDTAFRAPNAPERSTLNPMGYQWFPISWIDGSSEVAMRQGFLTAAELLHAYLEEAMAEEGVTPEQTVLIGFSQGTMMALHVAPRREDAVAGVVAFSGRLLRPDLLADDVVVRPPVLLIHGDMDDVVPPQSLPDAAEALQEAGWKDVYAHVMKGTAHGIAPDGLQVALAFMQDRLGYA